MVGFEADGQLGGLVVSSGPEGTKGFLPADSLFICIGGTPRNEGVRRSGLATDTGGYIITGSELALREARERDWPLDRQPLPLETSLPGVFAAGDVRQGSIKRCSAAIGEGSMAVALLHRHLAEPDGA